VEKTGVHRSVTLIDSAQGVAVKKLLNAHDLTEKRLEDFISEAEILMYL
jgi:hypothetical protein